jgi:hypothetical protein
MTIETKFNVGQEVWLMHANKALLAKILRIEPYVSEDSRRGVVVHVRYHVFAPNQKDLAPMHDEELLFDSKEGLIASL